MIWDGIQDSNERWLKMAKEHRRQIKTVHTRGIKAIWASQTDFWRGVVIANIVVLFGLVLFFLVSCAALTPATEVLYEGDIEGNYMSSEDVMTTVLATRDCMGFAERNFPLPRIRAMSGGNSVECGDSPKKGCYIPGWIIVPQNVELEVIGHEAVHHYLYLDTGDPDSEHKSELFLTCGGSVKSE